MIDLAVESHRLREAPEREFVPAEENPLEELPTSQILLSHPSAPSEAVRRALQNRHQTSEDRS